MSYIGRDDVDLSDDRSIGLARIRFILTTAVFLIGGVILIASGAAQVRECMAATSWPKTQAHITHSNVDVKTHRRIGKPSTTSYTVNIRYTYQVDGMPYESDRITLGTVNKSSESLAYTLASRYPAGSTADVYYDPVIHSHAALDTQIPTGTLYLMIGGGVMSLIGLVAAGFAISASRAEDSIVRGPTAREPDYDDAPLRRPI